MSESQHSIHEGLPDRKNRRITPWAWIPSVYFAQGLQYAIVLQLFAIVFFMLGIPIGSTLFWIGLVSTPWTIKPLWGPLVDKYFTKRGWTWAMQLLVGASFIAVGFSLFIPGSSPLFGPDSLPPFFYAAIFFLAVLAFAGATHDIACDGYYMMGLSEKQQAWYVGIRSTVFRGALIFANGILIWFAGLVQQGTGLDPVEVGIEASGGEAYTAPSAESYLEAHSWEIPSEQAVLIQPKTLKLEAGEKAYFSIRLAQKPEEEIVVGLRLDKGSQGISIPKDSERIVFNADNWSTATLVAATADDRITTAVSDTIKATSGNIKLSWWAVAMVCGGFFLTIAIWHKFIMPFPPGDIIDRQVHLPIYHAALALLLTIGVPWLLGLTLYKTMDLGRDALHGIVLGDMPADAKVASAFQSLREKVETDDPSIDVAKLRAAIDEARATDVYYGEKFPGKENDIVRLRGVMNVRRMLDLANANETDDFSTRALELIARKKSDPDFYGNPHIVDLESRLALIASGKLPDNEDDLSLLLAKSMAAAPALQASKDTRDLLETLNFATVANSGKFPESDAEFSELFAKSETVASKTAEKGFKFLFTAIKLLVLLFIIFLFVKVQPFKAGALGYFNALSNESGIGFAGVFGSFFGKPGMAVTLGFLLTFRLGEAQLAQVKNIFLLDRTTNGGLALTLGEIAFVNSVVYLVALTVGGLLGGILIAKYGLKSLIWLMVAAMNLPNALYIYLAVAKPEYTGFGLDNPINWVVATESFGYGFGFAAYLLIMILAAQGPHKTAHYALCTGAMALGYQLPGMWSGYLADLVSYPWFFTLVMFFTIPGMLFVPFLKIDPSFGLKSE